MLHEKKRAPGKVNLDGPFMLSPKGVVVADLLILVSMYHASEERAERWLAKPHKLFGRKPPRHFLDTPEDREKLRAYLRYELSDPIAHQMVKTALLQWTHELPWFPGKFDEWHETPFKFLSGRTPRKTIADGDFGRVRIMLARIHDGVFTDYAWPEETPPLGQWWLGEERQSEAEC